MNITASNKTLFFQNYYEDKKLTNASIQEKINHFQSVLHVQVGVHFFAIDDYAQIDSSAEQKAILRALEREFYEMMQESASVPA